MSAHLNILTVANLSFEFNPPESQNSSWGQGTVVRSGDLEILIRSQSNQTLFVAKKNRKK
jgi:hypothetical protein